MSRPDRDLRSPSVPLPTRLLRLRTVAAAAITAVALTGTGGALLAPAGADEGAQSTEGSPTPRHTDETAT